MKSFMEFDRQPFEKQEDDLRKIRNKYFHLIESGIITGYNLYPTLFDYSKGKLFLNYLHSDLKPEDEHFKELSGILREESLLEERVRVSNKIVDNRQIIERHADYLTQAEWEDPTSMRYFTFDGRELRLDEAKQLGIDVIGESLQYDLLIGVKNERELRKLINLFKKYTSKYKLNRRGSKVKNNGSAIINRSAISGSWDIPLLICTANYGIKPVTLQDF